MRIPLVILSWLARSAALAADYPQRAAFERAPRWSSAPAGLTVDGGR